MQRLEMCVDRRLRAGMVEQAVDVMMTSEVGDDRAGRLSQHIAGAIVASRRVASDGVNWVYSYSCLLVQQLTKRNFATELK